MKNLREVLLFNNSRLDALKVSINQIWIIEKALIQLLTSFQIEARKVFPGQDLSSSLLENYAQKMYFYMKNH